MEQQHREKIVIVCLVLFMASLCSGARVCDRDTVKDVFNKCGHFLNKRSIQDSGSSFVGRMNGLRAIHRRLSPPPTIPQSERTDIIDYDYEEREREETPIAEKLTADVEKLVQQGVQALAGSRPRRPRNLRRRLQGATSAVARNCEAVLQQMHELCARK